MHDYDSLVEERERLREAVKAVPANDPQMEQKIAYLEDCLEDVLAELAEWEVDCEC